MSIENEIPLFEGEKFDAKDKIKFRLEENVEDRDLIKSKERVQHHGEVFTPKWMVEKMLAEPSIQEKIHDLHATFLEPSAGEGAFLKEILHQKLNYVDQISNKTNWKENALWALMSIYGIELLLDNLLRARSTMIDVFINHYQSKMQRQLSMNSDLYKTAKYVIEANIVQGDTLSYVNNQGKLIEFSHWIPVDGKVQRKIFTYKSLFNNINTNDINTENRQLSLFDTEENNVVHKYKICQITKVYKEERINE